MGFKLNHCEVHEIKARKFAITVPQAHPLHGKRKHDVVDVFGLAVKVIVGHSSPTPGMWYVEVEADQAVSDNGTLVHVCAPLPANPRHI